MQKHKTLAFTGHRPESLPFGENELSASAIRIKTLLADEIMRCAAQGYDTFLAGGARGGDILFAEQVLFVKGLEYPDIRLITVVPHEGQANNWTEAWRERYFRIFSMMAAIAQDESRSISQNIRWGYEKRFAQGIHHMGNRRVLGYDEVNGVLTPNEDAWIVRMAFELFNQGMGYQKIAEAITAAGGKRMRGSTAFSASSIQSIVDNEIYVGDRMLQKRPPQHYLTKKPDPNAQYQTYYWRDTHEGIIDRETWEKAQAVLDARKRDRISGVYKKTPATHFLYGKVFCAKCGAPYKRRTLSGGTADGAPVYHKVWNCRERQKGKAGNGCRNAPVAEEELLRGISDALGWEWKGAEEFGTERFLREVQAVHLENGAVSVQKWTQRVSA